jgi:hypothetical protein
LSTIVTVYVIDLLSPALYSRNVDGSLTSRQPRQQHDEFGGLADVPAGIVLLWRSRTGGDITKEEARQAIENVSGFSPD